MYMLNTHSDSSLYCQLTRVDFDNSIFASLSSLNTFKLQPILNCPPYWWSPEVFSHICLHAGNPPLASCANAHSIQNLNTYPQLSFRVIFFIPSDLVHPCRFTTWSFDPPLGCQRSSGCPPHAQCYCSVQKLRFCGPL